VTLDIATENGERAKGKQGKKDLDRGKTLKCKEETSQA